MNIAVLGGGVEGIAVKKYFVEKGEHVQIFDNFTDEDIPNFKLEDYDLVFRSPSVHPQKLMADGGKSQNWTSSTKYFFDNCPTPIIGITGTKGKGTTCSITASILTQIIKDSDWPSRNVHIIGNIGNPAISELDQIDPDDIVIYEMSSFQLWDLEKSPHIAAILRVEPDHLDRHPDFNNYVDAKTNIARHQTEDDYLIYYQKNETSKQIAQHSPAHKLAYPPKADLSELLDNLTVPGEHNRENAAAAILISAAFFHLSLDEFIAKNHDSIAKGLANFKGLPHRCEFVRELNGVKYYDDNYSSAFPATDVAIKAFENHPTILIAGGKDRHLDLTTSKKRFFSARNLKKVILIGETKEMLAKDEDPEKYELTETLEEAVEKARALAEAIAEEQSSNYDLCIPSTAAAKEGKPNPEPIVLMSPGAASFDMFKNFGDRGDKFQALVKNML